MSRRGLAQEKEADVVSALDLLVGFPPIDSLAFLADQRGALLLDAEGDAVWFSPGRFDAAPRSHRILEPEGGTLSMRCDDPAPGGAQEYLPQTLVLKSSRGGVHWWDYLACPGEPIDGSCWVRRIEGAGNIQLCFEPAYDFKRGETLVPVAEAEGLSALHDGNEVAYLHSPGVRWSLDTEGGRALAEVALAPESPLTLRYMDRRLPAFMAEEGALREQALRFWRNISSGLRLPSVEPDWVERSALVLAGLQDCRTGGIVAAATTSLPEGLGGIRNWDYRFVWPRDASLSALATLSLGRSAEAEALVPWLLARIESCASISLLSPMFEVGGAATPQELVLTGVGGYAESRPVRVGNGAAHQIQMDVFGPVLHLMQRLGAVRGHHRPEELAAIQRVVNDLIETWSTPDAGIWELRSRPLSHLYSHGMCHLAVTSGITAFREAGRPVPTAWEHLEREIRRDVNERGFDPDMHAFTMAYGEPVLDAAVLRLGRAGVVEATDPRFVSTIDRIEEELGRGPTLYRYRFDDGLQGEEGGFNICTSWLIDALADAGLHQRAWAWFDRFKSLKTGLGLLSEQWDPHAHLALGNYPQAYSHIGLISNAWSLERSGP